MLYECHAPSAAYCVPDATDSVEVEEPADEKLAVVRHILDKRGVQGRQLSPVLYQFGLLMTQKMERAQS